MRGQHSNAVLFKRLGKNVVYLWNCIPDKKRGFFVFLKEIIPFNVKWFFYGKRSIPLNINGAVTHKILGSNVYSQ